MYVNTEKSPDSNQIVSKHLCCIYRTNEELLSLIVPFFIEGLQKNNKCMYILGEQTSQEVIQAFSNSGFNLFPHIMKKNFIFVSHRDIYFKNNIFSVRNITSNLVTAESEALTEGYYALRLAGGTSWVSKEIPIASEFLKYESVVNDFIKDSYIIAVCLYKESLFNHNYLIRVLNNHPSVYLYDKLIENTYFNFLTNTQFVNSSKFTYEQIVSNLYKQQN